MGFSLYIFLMKKIKRSKEEKCYMKEIRYHPKLKKKRKGEERRKGR